MPDLDSLPPLRDVIARHNLRAEKKLGQNFILDRNITDKIARAVEGRDDLVIIEIGPGPGGLTRSLLRTAAKKVIAIEYDLRAMDALRELSDAANGRLEVIHADALETDIGALAPGEKKAVVANLPYNIATPLLIRWLKMIRENPHAVAFMSLMFQREVADRLTAAPGGKDYGRLSVMAQWLCVTRRLFDVPPSVFVPPPKVTSSIVHFTPRPQDPAWPPFERMEETAAAAFGQRRKMIRSSMKACMPAIKSLGIDETLRAEQLPVETFVDIAKKS